MRLLNWFLVTVNNRGRKIQTCISETRPPLQEVGVVMLLPPSVAPAAARRAWVHVFTGRRLQAPPLWWWQQQLEAPVMRLSVSSTISSTEALQLSALVFHTWVWDCTCEFMSLLFIRLHVHICGSISTASEERFQHICCHAAGGREESSCVWCWDGGWRQPVALKSPTALIGLCCAVWQQSAGNKGTPVAGFSKGQNTMIAPCWKVAV